MTLAAALDLALDSYHVFPVRLVTRDGITSKLPALSRETCIERGWAVEKRGELKAGFYAGSTDPDRIADMWEAAGSGAEIGVATGASGLIVIDDDTAKKSDPAAAAWLERHRTELDATLVHRTTSGGRHYIFEADGEDIKSTKAFSAIDVRGSTGFVVWPPSFGYTVVNNVAPAPMSADLLRSLRAAQQDYRHDGINRGAETASNEALIEAIRSGRDFHDATLILTARLAAKGVSADERLGLIHAIYDSAVEADPDHHDHARWAARRADAQRLSESAELFRPVSDAEIEEAFSAPGKSSDDEIMRLFSGEPAAQPSMFLEIDGDELLTRDLDDINYIVPDYLVEGGLHSIAGPSGVGKTRYISLLIACLMTGRTDVMGLPAGRPARVMYFANEERAEDVERRVKATMHANNLTGGTKPLIRGKDNGTLRLLRQVDGRACRDDRVIDMIIQQIRETGTEIVIFDPFNTLGGDEENSAVAVSEVMDALREITAATGVAIIFIHHTPKDRAESPDALRGDNNAWRGSGAIYSALDMGFTLFPLLPDGIKKDDRQRLRRAIAGGICGKFIVQDTGKVREGETLAAIAYRFVGQEVRPGGRLIGALQVVRVEDAVAEMEMGLDMIGADASSAIVHEWAAPLIMALGAGTTETTMAEVDRILTEAKAGDWNGSGKALTTRGRGKRFLDLFATPQVSASHAVQVIHIKSKPNSARLSVRIIRLD